MNFSHKKLPAEAADKLRTCSIDTVKPFTPMLAPVYVFMRMNEKFVSVKGPLDFFTPEELERLRSFSILYLSEFVAVALPFRHAARSVRTLLDWKPDESDPAKLPPAPYENADAVLRILAPLWGSQNAIEPFFVSVFASELCDPIPGELMVQAREVSVDLYESAMFRSSWAVFLALHLGHCDLKFLSGLRRKAFEDTLSRAQGKAAAPRSYDAVDEVVSVARTLLANPGVRAIGGKDFEAAGDRVSQKMASRLKRAQESLMKPGAAAAPSIYGPGGFADV